MDIEQAAQAVEIVTAHVEVGIHDQDEAIRRVLDLGPDPRSLLLAAMLHIGHAIGAEKDSESPRCRRYEAALEAAADAYEELHFS